ncbi:MAG: hypothetical protein KC418_23880 [Anaerolineales bacterium]|nr:hypothetical protein [Anaerolineales bacterium]MCB8951061.1 hypothetical protein [Ardenticatenales bacterium]
MADEFDFLKDENAGNEPLPDWLEEASESEDGEMEDEFDRLRERTALASEMYEEMEEPATPRSGGFFSNLTPGQRLIISLLILLNVIIIIVGFLVVTGRLVF